MSAPRRGLPGVRARLALLACALLSPVLVGVEARAAGFAVVEQSPRAGGTGGAGVARTQDPSAAWYNPAAVAERPGLSAGAGLLVLFPGIEASARDGSWSEGLTTSPRLPPHAYLSYARWRLAGGVAFNVPFGTSVNWPETWAGRYQAVSSELQVFRVAPFVAWTFGPVRVGAGLHVDVASLKIERQLDFVDQEGHLALELNDVGLGGHASVHADVGRHVSLGASYKSRTALSLEGTARFDAPLAFSAKAQDQRASVSYTLPDLITMGIEVRPTPRVSAVLDLGVTVWSVYDELAIDFENATTPDARQVNSWETRVSVRSGVEAWVLRFLALRLGWFYDPTPVPARTLVPSSPDSNRVGLTVGAGGELPFGLALDVFYGYVHLLGQAAEDPENLQAEYAGRLHLFGVGLRYRWGPTTR